MVIQPVDVLNLQRAELLSNKELNPDITEKCFVEWVRRRFISGHRRRISLGLWHRCATGPPTWSILFISVTWRVGRWWSSFQWWRYLIQLYLAVDVWLTEGVLKVGMYSCGLSMVMHSFSTIFVTGDTEYFWVMIWRMVASKDMGESKICLSLTLK